jgi:putative colanic acid biosysnthesis UDP-glucose lipid carrier transferase
MSELQTRSRTAACVVRPEGGARPLHALHPPRRRRTRRIRPVGGRAKRLFDIVAAASALLVFGPVLLIIALAVVLESPGSALFLQRRGGLFGRPFLIYKFRTMRSADDGHVVSQVVQGDPRVTQLGALLRRLCIDELPQLINVLRGEMSLVGPRPHAIAHDELFTKIDSRYPMRRYARPGITGLAQVSGCRGLTADAASVMARTSYDLEYIARWSLWLDLSILARTVFLLLHLTSTRQPAPARHPALRPRLLTE